MRLQWDRIGERRYETGVDQGVLYIPNELGEYENGYAWNGLVSVTESPSGAEPNAQYADNIKYLNLVSAEEFAATIEAFTYPDEFEQCDGYASPAPGVVVGQQNRKTFGLCYRTRIGTDLNSMAGYKLHFIYGCLAAPSEKAYTTVNDSPEALTFSWEVSTTAVPVGIINGKLFAPTATVAVDSTKTDPDALATLLDVIYGTAGVDPRLPAPMEIISMATGTTAEVAPTTPAYNSTTKVITIPTVTGVEYRIDNEPVTGTVTITSDTVVTARPMPGYTFPAVSDNDWLFDF